MRYMTPDTPGTQVPEPSAEAKTVSMDVTARAAPMAMASPTPSPSPEKRSVTSAAAPFRRRRAFRTYGKKRLLSDSGPGESAALASKRHRTDSSAAILLEDDDMPVNTHPSNKTVRQYKMATAQTMSTTTTTATACVPSSPFRRAGILRYFKPMAPRRSSPGPIAAVASSSSSCCSSQPSTTDSDPPSSPPPMAAGPRSRHKRRLTIRPNHASGHEASTRRTKAIGKESKGAGTQVGTLLAASSSGIRQRLANVGGSTASSASSIAAPTTQTTLSLDVMGSERGSIRECRECNILYNPLHEKDAKFHARYHASVCGSDKGSKGGAKDKSSGKRQA